MGRSQRHKVVEQGIASNEELVAQGAINWEVAQGIEGAIEDAVANKPTLTGLNPTQLVVGVATTVQATGTNFTAECKVIVDGAETATTFDSATTLSFTHTLAAGPVPVLVRLMVQGQPVDTPPQTLSPAATPPARGA